MEPLQIRFRNSRGLSLAGIIERPDQFTRSRWVVLSHGMLSTKDSLKHTLFAQALKEAGYPSLRFDYSGQGESEGDPSVITFSNEIDDLKSAMNHLQKTQNATNFVLYGSSMGAGVSILTAAEENERVDGLILIASIPQTTFIYMKMNEEQRTVWQLDGSFQFMGRDISFELVEDAASNGDIAEAIGEFKGASLFIHGEDDELIDSIESFALSGEAQDSECIILTGTDHRFGRAASRKAMVTTALDWIKEKFPD